MKKGTKKRHKRKATAIHKGASSNYAVGRPEQNRKEERRGEASLEMDGPSVRQTPRLHLQTMMEICGVGRSASPKIWPKAE